MLAEMTITLCMVIDTFINVTTEGFYIEDKLNLYNVVDLIMVIIYTFTMLFTFMYVKKQFRLKRRLSETVPSCHQIRTANLQSLYLSKTVKRKDKPD